MVTLWKELANLYDAQATKKYGHVGGEVFIDWGNKLRFMKNEQLRRGLTQCVNDDSEYAPSLKTFLWLCEGKSKGLSHNSGAYKPVEKQKALTHKPDEKKVKSELSKMKDILGG